MVGLLAVLEYIQYIIRNHMIMLLIKCNLSKVTYVINNQKIHVRSLKSLQHF